jgi:two-component system phosphate regulon sensor histidine kinase PhoR
VLALIFRADEPAVFVDPQFAVGFIITAVATIVAVVGQWSRIPSVWLSVIPLIDIVAVIFIRTAASNPHEDVGLFVIAPVVWLALMTPLPLVLVGFIGLEFSVVYPLLVANESPHALYDWTILIVKPGLLMLVALLVRIVNSRLRFRQHQTERLAEQLKIALDASEQREITVTTLLNSLDAGIVLFDSDGAITMGNDVAGSMSKLACLPLDGRPVDVAVLQIYRPDRITPVALDAAGSLLEFTDQIYTDTVYWIGAPGDQRAVVAKTSPLGEGSELKGGTVAIVYDVTNMIEAVRVRDEFVSTTSHELRTPLTSILGYVDLIDAPGLGIEMEIEVIERNAMRLLGMISDLLDVKVQNAVQRREVDLSVLVGSAAGKRRSDADAAGVLLNYSSADSGGAVSTDSGGAASAASAGSTGSPTSATVAVVDALAIGRVVDNLLSNAIKFSHRGDSVTVTVEGDDAVVVITVVDTGVGISAEDQTHIFDQFFRTPSAQVQSIPGTGLGLTVTQSILEAHHATIAVDSTLGRGTTMTVTLPRWPRHSEL